MNFIAIDFETANEQRNSACELGLAVVQNNKVVETASWLIQPPQLRFNPFNTYLHGITAEHVADQPTFADLWPTLLPYFSEGFIIAHNASFDLSVLRHCLHTYQLSFPALRYSCSVQIARKVWYGLHSYRLNALSHLFEIPLDHHRALSDAVACARLSIHAFKRCLVDSPEELELALKVKVKKLC